MLGQSLAVGWLAAGSYGIFGTDTPFPDVIILAFIVGTVFGVLIPLPIWWAARPLWRRWWFWFRSPP